jgi:glucoamylase
MVAGGGCVPRRRHDIIAHQNIAPGGPGLPPRWTRGAKEAVGTAYSAASRVWYTVAAGILTEVYYPTIDIPQIRDVQFLVTDGRSFFHDERRDTRSTVDCVSEAALGFDIENVATNGMYTITKTLIGHPHQDCVLMHTHLEAAPEVLGGLQVYLLCAPHLEIGGWHNNAEVLDTAGGRILMVFKGSTWLAIGASVPLLATSCGYVAVNDGWTDLHQNRRLDWQFDAVYDGNIAVTGQLDLSRTTSFTVALAFGDTRHRAITALFQSLATPFDQNLSRFREEWARTAKRFAPAGAVDRDSARLYQRSINLLLAHEDKSYPGAMIAALSIPWGETKGDEEIGGYHLVWTRDLVQAATALLAAGDVATPLRVLVYLAVSQRADGGFFQNFWIDGRAHWSGLQLDEVSFPIVLAWRLHRAGALAAFDPLRMVTAACGFLVREGPATGQERWEEAAGYSPSTLAIQITALICAADLLDEAAEHDTAGFIREYADFLEAHVERWTCTAHGRLVPGIPRHYVRINPATTGSEDLETATLILANQPPGDPAAHCARDIVDAGFLELVRYGVRAADDPIVVDSLRVVDQVLKVTTPAGPCWRRYNHDGFGQCADGTGYEGSGVGRPWPLLTGERGHYELAAGRDAAPYLIAMQRYAVGIGLIPEQIWDEVAIPDQLLWPGKPTGAAMPLVWAHAEYIKLARSIADRRVFDRVEPVSERYGRSAGPTVSDPPVARPAAPEVWCAKRQFTSMPVGRVLRVLADEPFTLQWTVGDGAAPDQRGASATRLGVWYADAGPWEAGTGLRFRLMFSGEHRLGGVDYSVNIDR